MRSLLARSLVLGLFLTLPACGGGTAPATATPASEPGGAADATAAAPPANGAGNDTALDDFCLNTGEEVAAALEVDVAEAVSTETPGIGGSCVYSDSAGSVVFIVSVVIGEGARVHLDAYNAMAATGEQEAEPVSGIGEEAYVTHVADRWLLTFGKAGVAVSLGPLLPDQLGGDSARQRAAIEELARMAADRL
jgi:hypothetical protein